MRSPVNKDLQEKQYSKQDAQRRLDATLRGAFAGPPTPLKVYRNVTVNPVA